MAQLRAGGGGGDVSAISRLTGTKAAKPTAARAQRPSFSLCRVIQGNSHAFTGEASVRSRSVPFRNLLKTQLSLPTARAETQGAARGCCRSSASLQGRSAPAPAPLR